MTDSLSPQKQLVEISATDPLTSITDHLHPVVRRRSNTLVMVRCEMCMREREEMVTGRTVRQ